MGFKDKLFKVAYKPKTLKIVYTEIREYMDLVENDYDSKTTILQYTRKTIPEVRELAEKLRSNLIEEVSHYNTLPNRFYNVVGIDFMILEGNSLLNHLDFWEWKKNENE